MVTLGLPPALPRRRGEAVPVIRPLPKIYPLPPQGPRAASPRRRVLPQVQAVAQAAQLEREKTAVEQERQCVKSPVSKSSRSWAPSVEASPVSTAASSGDLTEYREARAAEVATLQDEGVALPIAADGLRCRANAEQPLSAAAEREASGEGAEPGQPSARARARARSAELPPLPGLPPPARPLAASQSAVPGSSRTAAPTEASPLSSRKPPPAPTAASPSPWSTAASSGDLAVCRDARAAEVAALQDRLREAQQLLDAAERKAFRVLEASGEGASAAPAMPPRQMSPPAPRSPAASRSAALASSRTAVPPTEEPEPGAGAELNAILARRRRIVEEGLRAEMEAKKEVPWEPLRTTRVPEPPKPVCWEVKPEEYKGFRVGDYVRLQSPLPELLGVQWGKVRELRREAERILIHAMNDDGEIKEHVVAPYQIKRDKAIPNRYTFGTPGGWD